MAEPTKGLNEDGGCSVDWSWLAGQRIASMRNALDMLEITFENGLVFRVRALLWQEKAFLSFSPHEPPAPDRNGS